MTVEVRQLGQVHRIIIAGIAVPLITEKAEIILWEAGDAAWKSTHKVIDAGSEK